MSEATQELLRVRPWPVSPGAAMCDTPGCSKTVEYALAFRFALPIDTLYLCYDHMRETAQNYGYDG